MAVKGSVRSSDGAITPSSRKRARYNAFHMDLCPNISRTLTCIVCQFQAAAKCGGVTEAHARAHSFPVTMNIRNGLLV